MKKFVRKMALFLCLFLTVLLLLDILSAKPPFRGWLAAVTKSSDYPVAKMEVDEAVERVKAQPAATKLVIGDSVCKQLFDGLAGENPEYCFAGNNRAVTMAGEYVLIKEFLEQHEETEEVYLFVGMDALQAELDVEYGYQYVMIPFGNAGLLPEFKEETRQQMQELYGVLFVQKPVIRLVGDSSVNRKLYLNYLKDTGIVKSAEETNGKISEITAQYLPEIVALCEKAGVSFYLLPTVFAEEEDRCSQARLLEQSVKQRGLESYFKEYFSNMAFYPSEQFSDGVHFGGEFEEQEELNRKIREVYVEKGYLQGLRMK